MAIARKNIVDNETTGFYHCTNRCVRRAFLCGFDEFSNKDYSHRKDWLESRIVELCDIFSVEIFAFAVMTDKEKLALYRERLGSLSWFMSRLNEPLAKQSNKEDVCTGRFWGRFLLIWTPRVVQQKSVKKN